MAGRAGVRPVRGLAAAGGEDRLADVVERSAPDAITLEPDHLQSQPIEIVRAPFVIDQIVLVVSAVEFDDQTRRRTVEIDNERPDRRLPAPFPAAEPASAKLAPKSAFGLGPMDTQLPRAL